MRDEQGLSLIEVLLVLVIITTVIIFSIKQYEIFRTDAEAQEIRANVDALFLAGTGYYQAHCNKKDLTGSNSPVTIPIKTLRDQGFLTTRLNINSIISDEGAYLVQLNRSNDHPDRSVNLSSSESVPLGKIIIWRVQVAAKITPYTNEDGTPKETGENETYKNSLAADCLSISADGSTVKPCTTSNSTGDYMVWERLPSFSTSGYQSNFWVSNPLLKQFNQMYTTYPILYLTNGSQTPNQNYLCGS